MEQQARGQHVGRAERVESTRNWLNAEPVDAHGMVKAAEAPLDPEFVSQEVQTIRRSLQSGVSKVRVDTSDIALVAAIQEQLTPDELEQVQFGAETPFA